jgi:hypothetical protein
MGKKGILTILIALITYSFAAIEEKSVYYIPLIIKLKYTWIR